MTATEILKAIRILRAEIVRRQLIGQPCDDLQGDLEACRYQLSQMEAS